MNVRDQASAAGSKANACLPRPLMHGEQSSAQYLRNIGATSSGRLEKIEREIEKKSDKENVDLIVRGINDELARHAEEIKSLHAGLEGKVGVETMWKVVGLVVALGGIISGVISAIINYFTRH